MRYPAFLKENDVAGVTAPSFGIRESDLGRYFAAKEFFASHGINIVETADVFTSHICASAPFVRVRQRKKGRGSLSGCTRTKI